MLSINAIKPDNNFRISVISYYYNRKDNINVYIVNTLFNKVNLF